MKRKAKPVNIKTKATPPPAPAHGPPGLSWWKASIFFKNANDCRQCSMVLAIRLRMICPMAYFARYTSAVESRTDYYFVKPPEVELPVIAQVLTRFDNTTLRISDILPCEGSMAHSMGLDVAIAIWTKHIAPATTTSAEGMRKACEELADVMHWSTNALGIDYCDEAKVHLYSIDRIVNIFSNSINLGNKMTAAAKKASRKQPSPERN